MKNKPTVTSPRTHVQLILPPSVNRSNAHPVSATNWDKKYFSQQLKPSEQGASDNMDSDLTTEFECGEFRCRNMFWEFIYIVGIPAAVLTIVVLSSCLLVCLGLCKRKRKLSPEDQTLLLRYQSIRHASLSLRNLSHNRDTPLLSSSGDREARTASLYLDTENRYRRGTRGTASAPGTLQRDRDRQHRHNRDRNSDIIPSQYSVPPSFPSEGDINRASSRGSGVEYAEVHHGLTAAAASTASSQKLT